MAAGIKKIGDVYDSDWYKESVAKAERGNREHVARYDRSFAGIMAKADNRGNGDRNDDGDEIDRADGGNAITPAKSRICWLRPARIPHRASALSHLLHSPQGQALLARMHKKDDPQQ